MWIGTQTANPSSNTCTVNQEGLHVVTLAIDLSGIMQQAWRRLGEKYGDPLITDRVPSDATTRLLWTFTDRMLANPLTKEMRLEKLMAGTEICLIPTKEKVCETEDELPHDMA